MVSLVLLILVAPFSHGTNFSHIIVDGLLSLVLLAVANAASETRRIKIIVLALAILVLLFLWANVGHPSNPGRLAGLILYILLNMAIVGLVLRRTLLAPVVTFEVLCDSISVYLLIGVTWALIYVVMDTIDPGSFESLSPSIEKGWTGFIYFSFVTLTTVGYGDIAPGNAVSRLFATAEAITGQLYLTIMIALVQSTSFAFLFHNGALVGGGVSTR